ncbi:hypothetical protein [Angustibacter luteus]|uniref:Uncharacterized protein n=1 Tax=Angustibacter luteus TaxID=658456 RepID=A0ABW1JD38_9ACTN
MITAGPALCALISWGLAVWAACHRWHGHERRIALAAMFAFVLVCCSGLAASATTVNEALAIMAGVGLAAILVVRSRVELTAFGGRERPEGWTDGDEKFENWFVPLCGGILLAVIVVLWTW